MNDLIIREITNGTWFILNAGILMVLLGSISERVWHAGGAWHYICNNYARDDGGRAAIALSIFFVGSSMRALWVWLVLFCQNATSCTSGMESLPSFLLYAVCIGIWGALCCVRVFSHDRWGNAVWISIGVAAIAIPIFVHLTRLGF